MKTVFIAVGPAHLRFHLPRLKSKYLSIDLILIYDDKIYPKSIFVNALSAVDAVMQINSVTYLEHEHLIRNGVNELIVNNCNQLLNNTNKYIVDLVSPYQTIIFGNYLNSPLVRWLVTSAYKNNNKVSLIWYEDGLVDYLPRRTYDVHPLLKKSEFNYLFTGSESDIPDCCYASMYPNLIESRFNKVEFGDIFNRTSLIKSEQFFSGKLFLDKGAVEFLGIGWTFDSYKKIIQEKIIDEFSIKTVKLNPDYDNRAFFEDLGFSIFDSSNAVEDCVRPETTCFAFASAAIYRLPFTSHATGVCIRADYNDKYNSIFNRMGVTVV